MAKRRSRRKRRRLSGGKAAGRGNFCVLARKPKKGGGFKSSTRCYSSQSAALQALDRVRAGSKYVALYRRGK